MEEVLFRDVRRVKARYLRWMSICLFFALATTAINFISPSWAFAVVAVLFWFFTWNRWMEFRQVRPITNRPDALSENDAAIWTRIAFHYFSQSLRWRTISTWIAGGLLLAMICFNWIVVLATTNSPAIRGLYGLCGVLAVLILLTTAHSRIKSRQQRWRRLSLQAEFWKDLT